MPLYGPPLSGGNDTPLPVPAPLPSGFGAPSSPMMMPVATVPIYGDDEDDGSYRFDQTTEENTRLNVAGRGVVDVPSGSSTNDDYLFLLSLCPFCSLLILITYIIPFLCGCIFRFHILTCCNTLTFLDTLYVS